MPHSLPERNIYIDIYIIMTRDRERERKIEIKSEKISHKKSKQVVTASTLQFIYKGSIPLKGKLMWNKNHIRYNMSTQSTSNYHI